MNRIVLLLIAGGYIVIGLWQAMDNHPYIALVDLVLAAGCIALSRCER